MIKEELLHDEDEQAEVDHLIVLYFSWLESHTPGKTLPPQERLNLAWEAEREGIKPVAKKHTLKPIVVERAVRDLEAVLIHHHNLSVDAVGNPEVIQRTLLLRELEDEMRRWVRLINYAGYVQVINKVPHVKTLIEHYVRYRSLDSLLEPLRVPFTNYQERSVRRYLQTTEVSQSLDGLEPLARRYVLAKWLVEHKSFSKENPETLLLNSAVHILEVETEGLPEPVKARIKIIRFFLKQIMQAERVMLNGRFKRRKDQYLARQDMVEHYREFQEIGEVPEVLKEYANQVVTEVPQSQRLPFIQDRSLASTTDWVGQRFLENALAWRGERITPFSTNIFLQNTSVVLKEAKAAQAIPPKKS